MPFTLSDLRKKNLDVLILEDNPGDVDLLFEFLKDAPGLEISSHVFSKLTDVIALEKEDFDVILLDLNLPGSYGIETLTTVKMLFPNHPIVLLTGMEEPDLLEHAFSAGAQDYLVKGTFSARELGRVIRHAIERNGLINRLQESTQQLQANQERLEAIVSNSLEGILVVSPEGNIRFSNPAAQEILGQSGNTMVGQSFGQSLPLGENKSLDLYQPGRGTITVELASTLFEWEGEGAHLVMLKDVTQRRKMEVQLQQSQKMKALGCLSGGIAHEFNNLLTIISGNSELLENAINSEDRNARRVESILHATKRAAELVYQLSSFSQKTIGERTSLRLNDLIEETGRMFKTVLGENISFDCKLSQSLPSILADSSSVEQVLSQLVVNARDAMPEGGLIKVKTYLCNINESYVATGGQSRIGPAVCMSISDEGTGINDHFLDRIFDPFFTTKSEGKGTGLGLTSAIGIMQQHEGWIDVETEIGKGSTFTLYFPAEEVVGDVGENQDDDYSGIATILLVEDEKDLLILNAGYLKTLGYCVYSAEDGEEAMKLWEEHKDRIDILLSDFMMPGDYTGRQLAEHMCVEKQDLQVILTSGYQRENGIDTEDTQVFPFLLKPYSIHELAKAVKHSLGLVNK